MANDGSWQRLWDKGFCQRVDKLSSERFGVPTLTLMENAGRSVFESIVKRGFDKSQTSFVVLAGPGNNGGDALVCARYLLAENFSTHVILVNHDRKKISASCQHQLAQIKSTATTVKNLKLKKSVVIIDGILGIGFTGELKDQDIIHCLQEARALNPKWTFAVDVPSGIDVDDASEQHVYLPADVTVTFGGYKPAQVVSPARQFFGEVEVNDIGFAPAAVQAADEQLPAWITLANSDSLLKNNPWANLSTEAHKYDRGHVLIMGGSEGKWGALKLCALAALRTGCGWATVATQAPMGEWGDFSPEITFEKFFDTDAIDADKLQTFLQTRNVKAVVIGPGCMHQPLDKQSLLVLAQFNLKQNGFIVIDAGALHNIFDLMTEAKIKFDGKKVILTPHPGEWQKLSRHKMQIPPPPLNADQIHSATSQARSFGVHLCYKHATPVLVGAKEYAITSNVGSNVLAKAGSGDVLCGLIAAHGARGESGEEAFFRSYALLAKSAERAAQELGEQAVLASDIIGKIGLCNS